MHKQIPPTERLQLGIDQEWEAQIHDQTRRSTMRYVSSELRQTEVSMLTPALGSIATSTAVELANYARGRVLAEPYFEHEELLSATDSTTHDGLATRKYVSFKDHGVRIYPAAQFEDAQTCTPYPVVESVNSVVGLRASEQTDFAHVYWWWQTTVQVPLKDERLAAIDALKRPRLHHPILERALAPWQTQA